MSFGWRKIRNGFLEYSRGDRNAIIILSLLIILTIIANIIVRSIEIDPAFSPEEVEQVYAEWNRTEKPEPRFEQNLLFGFNPNTISKTALDSLAIPENVKKNLLKYRNAGGKFKSKNQLKKLYGMTDSVYKIIEPYILIPKPKKRKAEPEIALSKKTVLFGTFDPNTANIDTLLKYEMNKFQAKNLLAYRNSSGRFNTPDDLLKVYGLDSLDLRRIQKYILIESNDIIETVNIAVVPIEINSADSVRLVLLKGIGPVFARRIMAYRNLLGGYSKKEQLLEVYGFTAERYAGIEKYISVDTTLIRKMRLNYVEFSEMLRHPYFKKEQVTLILKEKEEIGPIKDISELRKIEGIDSEFVKKIRPYIRFE